MMSSLLSLLNKYLLLCSYSDGYSKTVFQTPLDLSTAGIQLDVKLETQLLHLGNQVIPRLVPSIHQCAEPMSMPAGTQETVHQGYQDSHPSHDLANEKLVV